MAQIVETQPFPIPLMTGGTVVTDDGNVQGSLAINLKLRQISTDGKPGTPTDHGGLTQVFVSSYAGESDRGGIVWNGLMYRVQGGSLYSYDTTGVRTRIGSVANDGTRCRLDYSFDFLIIVSAGALYYYSPTGFSEIQSASVVSGGSGYSVGDTITLGQQGIYATLQVTGVSSGAVTSVSVVNAPFVQTKYQPGNPLSQVLSSGSGTGASFNATWITLLPLVQVFFGLGGATIGTVVDACYMAGYVMVTDGTSVYNSNLVNPYFFPGYFGSAEYDPDGISYIFKLNNQLYIGGQRTHQVMQNTGGNNFPFSVAQSYTFDIGCVSRQTMCYFNRTLAWIGGGRNMPYGVWILNGNEPNKISSATVDYELSQLSADQINVVTLEAISFEDSELLYVHLPSKTLVFDSTATVNMGVKFWTQLNSGPTDTSIYRARNFVRFNGEWMCGDLADNRVGFLDSTTGGHYGAPVLHRAIGPMAMLPLASAGLREVELKCITGQPGDTSRISMQYTADGIRWSRIRYAPAVPRAAYDKRIRWRPAGITRNRMQVKVEHVTTQHVCWFGLIVELEPLNV